jgi:hypothetical protein
LGLQAERAGDYQLAERNYERALINARLGHAPDAGMSMVAYNLGRVKGYLCKYEDAEKLLTEALRLQEKAGPPDSAFVSMRLFELARFHYDRGEHERAIPYFARGFQVAGKLDAESKDPIGFAEVLEEYAIALEKSGDASSAFGRKSEAAKLRALYPGRPAASLHVRYNQPCPVAVPTVENPRAIQAAAEERTIPLRLVSNPLDRDFAALQLVELNWDHAPRNLISNSQFHIRPGFNRLGLRASSIYRLFPRLEYLERYICLEFEAQPGRAYAVSVASHERNWAVSVANDDPSGKDEVRAHSAQLPFDGQVRLPCGGFFNWQDTIPPKQQE